MTDTTPAHTNRLIDEKSPYLLQHAHNPVDWFPWGAEAFAKAQAEDKLVLVSIGYATCHWCHVMERESFEDAALADYLNAHYVAIKVDREERPDVDKIYMDALQAMSQQGGWPLNMFVTPDGRPVTGGTYFPPHEAHGRKSFRQVLELVDDAWQNRRDEIFQNAEVLTEHLQKASGLTSPAGMEWNHAPFEAAAALYRRTYDRNDGGFALQQQNKFPPSMGLMLLLREHARTGEADLLEMVEGTLKAMVSGGIYDQLGGGLSRYSTDYQWLVPHFEKMLYDNALFLQALTECWQVTGKDFYRVYAEDVIGYVLRDMTSPEGAFYSAEDADSEGEEGLFYTWTPEELDAVLDETSAAAVAAYWDVTPQGNFEHGRSILHTHQPLADVARDLGVELEQLAEMLGSAREQMLTERAKRIRPLRDDKVLTSWNALMISALAKAGQAFSDVSYVEAALRAASFLREHLKDDTGRLLRRWRDGEARFPAYLVDHAQFGAACLDLYECTGDTAWFAEALHLAREINRLFRNDQGPYYDTGSDGEALLTRGMEGYDGVEPSGNSAAALLFLRLNAYGVQEGLLDDALRILAGFHQHLMQAGVSFPAMLSALHLHLAPPAEVAVMGDPATQATQALLQVVWQRFTPHTVLAATTAAAAEDAAQVVPLLEGRVELDGKPTAYVCRQMACKLPVHAPEDLARDLGLAN